MAAADIPGIIHPDGDKKCFDNASVCKNPCWREDMTPPHVRRIYYIGHVMRRFALPGNNRVGCRLDVKGVCCRRHTLLWQRGTVVMCLFLYREGPKCLGLCEL